MADSSAGLHEEAEALSAETRDFHRAIVSLMEELEAVDWYQQRIDAAGDEQLRAILAHNRDEELEHAAMLLEWLRRRHPNVEAALKLYLFSEGDITKLEAAAETGEKPNAGRTRSLGIGDLKA